MRAYPETVINEVSERLRVERAFLAECLAESLVELHEETEGWALAGGGAFRLRRLQRLCRLLGVDVPVAALVLELTERLAALEEEVRSLRAAPAPSPWDEE